MKKIKILSITVLIMALMQITALAGEWKSDANGWWWRNDDGSYPVNCRQWIDGDNDGIAQCYYFDVNGYCLMNTITPDQCMVNESGAWTVNGVIQTQAVATTTNTAEQTNSSDRAVPETSENKTKSSCSSASGISSQPYDGYTIIVNTNTLKYHVPSCSSVKDMKTKNTGYADNAGYLESIGYSACKRCH